MSDSTKAPVGDPAPDGVQFPTSFPAEDARHVADAIRNPGAHCWADVALSSWRLQGFALYCAAQTHAHEAKTAAPKRTCSSPEELAAFLDDCCKACDPKLKGAGVGAQAIDWSSLFASLSQLLPLILQLFKK